MQATEQNIYVNFTKSIVNSFEEFVNDVEKHCDTIADVELKCKLMHIGKKLQTIFNVWENTQDKKSSGSGLTSEECIKNGTESKIEILKKSDSWDDFESMIANSVGDTEAISMNKSVTTDISTPTFNNKLEFSILDDVINTSKTEETVISKTSSDVQLSRREAEIVRKFTVEKVKEEWIRGSNGFYVEQISAGSWKCNPCKLEALSYNNIISHVSGKAHIRKLDNYTRETSKTRRKNETSVNTDSLGIILSDINLELMKRKNGDDVIVPLKGYYCSVCRGTLDSEEALKLHVSGGKHRKNCES